nr:hypothetical protein [Cressdnaviricota sp.]
MVKSALDHVIDMMGTSVRKSTVVNPYARKKPRETYVPKPFVKRPSIPVKYMSKGWQNAIQKPRQTVSRDHNEVYDLRIVDGKSKFVPREGVLWYYDLPLHEKLFYDKKYGKYDVLYGGKPNYAYDDPKKEIWQSALRKQNFAESQAKQMFLLGIDPAKEKEKADIQLAEVAKRDLSKQIEQDDKQAAYALVEELNKEESFARIPKRRLKKPVFHWAKKDETVFNGNFKRLRKRQPGEDGNWWGLTEKYNKIVSHNTRNPLIRTAPVSRTKRKVLVRDRKARVHQRKKSRYFLPGFNPGKGQR